tara:strand:+ start:1380 stop:2087 length:708 start_codon:yes stop_codon:yes gene_type:complete
MGKYGMRTMGKSIGGGGTRQQIIENEQPQDEIRIVHPSNVGWVDAKLPLEAVARLWEYIEKSEQAHNDYLAGNISRSEKIFDQDDWFAENILSRLTNVFIEEHGPPRTIPATDAGRFKLKLNDFWVNFQNKHEFNPVHEHRSCLYSFVVWMQIPTDWREQHELDFVKQSNYPCASDFAFMYQNTIGEMNSYNYWLDKESEGRILLFPGKLNHVVYPFYGSDEQRISISGNIGIDV